jgi:hypothetical protein
MAMVIDIRRLLQGQSLELAERYSKGLYCLVLAFAKYADIDPEQLAVLIATAEDAESIDAGTVDVLEAINYW